MRPSVSLGEGMKVVPEACGLEPLLRFHGRLQSQTVKALSPCGGKSTRGTKQILFLRAQSPLLVRAVQRAARRALPEAEVNVGAIEDMLSVGDSRDPMASLALYMGDQCDIGFHPYLLTPENMLTDECPLQNREGTFDLVYLSLDGIQGDRDTVAHWVEQFLAKYMRPRGYGLLYFPTASPLSVFYNSIDPELREFADIRGQVPFVRSKAINTSETFGIFQECGLECTGCGNERIAKTPQRIEEAAQCVTELLAPLEIDQARFVDWIERAVWPEASLFSIRKKR